MSRHAVTIQAVLGAAILLISSACGGGATGERSAMDTLSMDTKADTVAMSVYEEFGGPDAWASLKYLRFDFGGGNDSVRTIRAYHLWDRMTGRYRLEMPAGRDSVYVALFNVNTRGGDVYLNGAPVDSSQEAGLLERAYQRFINDTYWLLMPVKMFDPGVSRSYVADSSSSDMDVLHLSFGDVGLTPGDQYWVYVDRETGRVDHWAFKLQHHPADHVPEPISWTAYKTLQTAGGDILVSERKVRNGYITFTDSVAAPAEVAAEEFTDPNPRMMGS